MKGKMHRFETTGPNVNVCLSGFQLRRIQKVSADLFTAFALNKQNKKALLNTEDSDHPSAENLGEMLLGNFTSRPRCP